jgi:hypothetical protein
MINRLLKILVVVLVLALSVIACDFSASTAAISSAKLTADSANVVETAVFKPDQPFNDVVSIANAPDTTKVKAVWYAISDAGVATQIIDKEVVGSGSPITFSATNANPWPVGKYKVELYLNDKLDRTQEFSVQ